MLVTTFKFLAGVSVEQEYMEVCGTVLYSDHPAVCSSAVLSSQAGPIPPALGKLKALTILWLNDNKLSGES